jgi:hypothetical protein
MPVVQEGLDELEEQVALSHNPTGARMQAALFAQEWNEKLALDQGVGERRIRGLRMRRMRLEREIRLRDRNKQVVN